MSALLKKIAAGETFDLVEGIREIAKVLVAAKINADELRTGEQALPPSVNGAAPKKKNG